MGAEISSGEKKGILALSAVAVIASLILLFGNDLELLEEEHELLSKISFIALIGSAGPLLITLAKMFRAGKLRL